MSHNTNSVYVNGDGDYPEPEDVQHHRYDGDDPLTAINSYARTMHQHTKRQLERASRVERANGRRSPAPTLGRDRTPNLATENSRSSIGTNGSA
ncbi:MAG: hypothetical protein M1832_002840 [Thelocarpon impressellum]|nr:MAG: hypothetical protein M1832_002840 [Thelocarpon impressellum]